MIFFYLKLILKSSGFEKKYGDLSHIKVNEVFGFVSDIGSKISSYNAVPSRVVLLVELFFNKGGNILPKLFITFSMLNFSRA
jgi:hypothetical protein